MDAKSSLAVAFMVHDDVEFIRASMESFSAAKPVRVYVSKAPWNGLPGNWEAAQGLAEAHGADVIVGEWRSEAEHRRAVLEDLREQGFQFALLPDTDEVIEPKLLETLLKFAENDLADRVYVEIETYWKRPDLVIRPPEPFTPLMLVAVHRVEHVHLRQYQGGRDVLLNRSSGVVHHLAYAGSDARIKRKIDSWSHRHEVDPGWYARKWKGWESDPLERDLHPTHPANYRFVEPIEVPEPLACVDTTACWQPLTAAPLDRWPTITISIPLYGGEDEIASCLDALANCEDLLHEVFVIDNASPDAAAEVAQKYPFVTLIKNESNLGFAVASNQGYRAGTGEVVLFLNSDAIVTRSGLIELMRTLLSSQAIGLAAPLTNFGCTEQAIELGLENLQNLDRFGTLVANRQVPDLDTDFVIGFCLAVRRSHLEEVGGFDEIFEVGGSDDLDLCYRFRRVGYRAVIAQRSYVHHLGSRSFARLPDHGRAVVQKNDDRLREKWQRDLEFGFASNIIGSSRNRIQFNEDRRPERIEAQASVRAQVANISLSMIVKNEERVLAQCLKSAKPFFKEIVIVDTGSTDRTIEIARSFGAKVIESPWQDSFSQARNVSLQACSGDWIFFLDADDTLPLNTGLLALDAVINAPAQVHGFVIPVQFVEDSPKSGTRVDHLKLFRNLPNLTWTGRIHEQILPSLSTHGGIWPRLAGVVRHSGYDNSPEGQRRKRERDEKLLKLDLQDDPDNPFFNFNAGMTHHHLGEPDQAIPYLQRSVRLSHQGVSFVRKSYALWIACELMRNDLRAAQRVVEEALAAQHEDPELFDMASKVAEAHGDRTQAIELLLRIESYVPNGQFSSFDIGLLSFKTDHRLAMLYAAEGNWDAAKDRFLRAIDAEPKALYSSLALLDLSLQRGDLRTALQMRDHLEVVGGPSRFVAEKSMECGRALHGPLIGLSLLDDLIDRYPHAQEPRLVRAQVIFDDFPRKTEIALADLHWMSQMDNPAACFMLGVYWLRVGRTAAAAAWLERSLAINPGHEQTQKLLSEVKLHLAASQQ